MADHLMQITLYPDGMITVSGKRPDDLSGVLRDLADAAEAGFINWVGVNS